MTPLTFRKHGDLLIVAAIALTSLVLVASENLFPTAAAFGPVALARAMAGVPMVLFLPGYALLAAGMPARPLSVLERSVAAFGLSAALVIAAALILHATTGISPLRWAMILSGFTLVTVGVAAWRRNDAPQAQGAQSEARSNRPALALVGAISLVTLGGVAAIAVAMSVISAQRVEAVPSTQFWMVSTPNPNPNPNPTPDMQTASRVPVDLGVRNNERSSVDYSVTLLVDGKPALRVPVGIISPGNVFTVSLDIPVESTSRRVEAHLYTSSASDEPVRSVQLDLARP